MLRRLRKARDECDMKLSDKGYINRTVHTDGIDSVWSVLNKATMAYITSMNMKYLPQYVNGFIVRLNDGNCGADTKPRINSFLTHTLGKRLT